MQVKANLDLVAQVRHSTPARMLAVHEPAVAKVLDHAPAREVGPELDLAQPLLLCGSALLHALNRASPAPSPTPCSSSSLGREARPGFCRSPIVKVRGTVLAANSPAFLSLKSQFSLYSAGGRPPVEPTKAWFATLTAASSAGFAAQRRASVAARAAAAAGRLMDPFSVGPGDTFCAVEELFHCRDLGGETFFFGRVSVIRLGLLSFPSRKLTTNTVPKY